jgi:hypothetical protein
MQFSLLSDPPDTQQASAGASLTPALLAWTAILLGAAIRLYGLSIQSLWEDELFTAMYAVPYLPHEHFLDLLLAEPHPPLYYLVMRLWLSLVPLHEWSLRLPGALCSAAAPAVLFVLTRRVIGTRAASAAAILFALSSFCLFYAQEARFYAPLQLLSAASAGLWLQLLASDEGDRPRGLAMLAVVNLLLSLTHLFGFLVVACEWPLLLVLRPRLRRDATLYLAAAASTVPYAGWLIWSYPHFSRLVGPAYWLKHFTIVDFVSPLRSIFAQPSSLLILLVPFMLAGTASWRHLAAAWRGRSGRLLTGCAGVTIMVAMLAAAVSITVTIIYMDKNLIAVFPFCYVALGMLLAAGSGGAAMASRAVAAVFLLSLASLVTFIVSGYPIRGATGFYAPYKEQVREGVAWVWHHAGPDDVVLLPDSDDRDPPFRNFRLYTEHWNDPQRMRQVVRLTEDPARQAASITAFAAEAKAAHHAIFLFDTHGEHFVPAAVDAVLAAGGCAQVESLRGVWIMAIHADRVCATTDLQFPTFQTYDIR